MLKFVHLRFGLLGANESKNHIDLFSISHGHRKILEHINRYSSSKWLHFESEASD